MSDAPGDPVSLGAAPPETVLPPADASARARLDAALGAPTGHRREAVADVVRSFPAWSEAWAAYGELARDDLEAYAAFRVGYHRGLDALRRAGWRGSGLVRFEHPGNRGVLRCVAGLAHAAGAIGEADEEDRCRLLLRQLDPSGPLGRTRDPGR